MKGKLKFLEAISYFSVILMVLGVTLDIQAAYAETDTLIKTYLGECLINKRIKYNRQCDFKTLAYKEIKEFRKAANAFVLSYSKAIAKNPGLKEQINNNCNSNNIVECIADLVPDANKEKELLEYHYKRAVYTLKVAIVTRRFSKTEGVAFLSEKFNDIRNVLVSKLFTAKPDFSMNG